MSRHRGRRVIPCVAAACGLALLVPLSGCGPKKHPTRTNASTQPNPPSQAMADVDTRMSDLRQRSQELTTAVQQLPGRGALDDRKRVADAFGKASSSLELLGGPNPGGAFRQELRIVDNTQRFLQSQKGAVAAAADPSIDTGLRSIEGALTSVREHLFPNDEKIKQQLDLYRTRLSELDSVRGPIHSLVVAQAFEAASNVIDTMSLQLEARNDAIRQAQQPAAAPTPAPSQPTAAAPTAIPASATTPPPPVARTAKPAPAPAPAAAAATSTPSAASIPPPPAQKRSYEELQRDYDKLQQQYQELQQKMQQQQPAAPAR